MDAKLDNKISFVVDHFLILIIQYNNSFRDEDDPSFLCSATHSNSEGQSTVSGLLYLFERTFKCRIMLICWLIIECRKGWECGNCPTFFSLMMFGMRSMKSAHTIRFVCVFVFDLTGQIAYTMLTNNMNACRVLAHMCTYNCRCTYNVHMSRTIHWTVLLIPVNMPKDHRTPIYAWSKNCAKKCVHLYVFRCERSKTGNKALLGLYSNENYTDLRFYYMSTVDGVTEQKCGQRLLLSHVHIFKIKMFIYSR